MNAIFLKSIFKLLMFIVMLISFFIFIMTLVVKSKEYRDVFSTWQFPMLLAIFLEVYLIDSI
jgi:hypothetical protein